MRRLHAVLVAASLCLALPLVACRSMTPVDRASSSSGIDVSSGALSSTELPDVSNGLGAHNGFFPLEVGNHWTYREVTDLKSVFLDGRPPVEATFESTIDWELVCEEARMGRRYVVQKETTSDESHPPFVNYFRERQDARGLYTLEVNDPPACSPAPAPRGGVALESARMGEGDSWRERAGSQLLAQLSSSMS